MPRDDRSPIFRARALYKLAQKKLCQRAALRRAKTGSADSRGSNDLRNLRQRKDPGRGPSRRRRDSARRRLWQALGGASRHAERTGKNPARCTRKSHGRSATPGRGQEGPDGSRADERGRVAEVGGNNNQPAPRCDCTGEKRAWKLTARKSRKVVCYILILLSYRSSGGGRSEIGARAHASISCLNAAVNIRPLSSRRGSSPFAKVWKHRAPPVR